MVSQKYRWDFIGLSTDTKPTSETSEKVVNGSTYYCSDTSKLYVYCDGTWYERKPLDGGGGGGGTSDFNDLSNRPKYNGSDMTGSTNIPEVKTYTAGSNVAISDQNVISATDTTYTAGTNVTISDQNVISATDTTYSAFTGTDGTAAGVAGLVPAPATTDAGKFLKADGTWDTAGGGGGTGIIELTSADYNYPTDNPTQIAAWLLPDGIYHSASTAIQWSAYGDSAPSGTFIKTTNSSNMAFVFFYKENGLNEVILSQAISAAHYTNLLTSAVKQSTGTSTTDVMSQNATTSMVFDSTYPTSVRIGSSYNAGAAQQIAIGRLARTRSGTSNIAIGNSADSKGSTVPSIAIGAQAIAEGNGSIALGTHSNATQAGQMDISTGSYTTEGYNSSNYRLLTGLYDGQSDHDAATVGQIKMGVLSATPTGTTAGFPGRLYTYDSGGGTYEVYLCVHDNGDNTYVWKQVSLI